MDKNPLVDEYIEQKTEAFSRPICEKLRAIYLEQGLTEEIKWGMPCYSHHGNLCSIGAFNEHVSSWFFKGVLLSDPNCILRKAQEQTQGLRSLYYTDVKDIDEKVVIQFVKEAMILNEKGIRVEVKKKPEVIPPDYFMAHINKHPQALATYEELSPSSRKEYILWVTGAKRDDTRHRRIRKMLELLSQGRKLNDKYRGKS